MKHFGQTKKRKSALTLDLRIVMIKPESLKTLTGACSRGGDSNKYTFRKVSQLSFRTLCFRKDSQVRNACIFASFRKFAFAAILKFHKL